MNKQGIYTFIAASLAFLVPFPGRFVYGVVLVIELIFLMIIGTCVSSVSDKIRLGDAKTLLCLVAITSFTILYKHILIITQTEIAMTLGFLLYIPTASSFIIGYIFNDSQVGLKERLISNMSHTLKFSLFSLFFFLISDILGYGTFTFFGKNHIIYEKVILDPDKVGVFSFFASIPGALLLCSVIVFIEVAFSHKMQIIEKSEHWKKSVASHTDAESLSSEDVSK